MRLGLGTVQFGLPYGVSNVGGQVDRGEAAAIVGTALGAGFTVFDTAAAYGTAEAVLADVLPNAHGARVVTKTLPLASGGLDVVLDRVRQSARILGDLDTVLVHSAGDLTGGEGAKLWAGLQALQREGVCRRIGISAYAADGPLALAQQFRPEVMQIPVSLLDQRLVRDGQLAELASLGVEVHARSLFLQGLLFLEAAGLPPKLAYFRPQLTVIRDRIALSGLTPLAAALAFALAQPHIAVALVGVTRRSELDAILVAANSAAPSGFDWAACAVDDPLVLTPSLW
jgi:aryl-alcohol dehydrogenase-like predicted oxidoreductase